MKTKLSWIGTAFMVSVVWVSEAIAVPGQGEVHSPEIDGPASIAAVALLVGIGALLYSRVKR